MRDTRRSRRRSSNLELVPDPTGSLGPRCSSHGTRATGRPVRKIRTRGMEHEACPRRARVCRPVRAARGQRVPRDAELVRDPQLTDRRQARHHRATAGRQRTVYDVKTGEPRPSYEIQVKLYMLLLPWSNHGRWQNLSQISRQYEEGVAAQSPTVGSCGVRSTRALTLWPSRWHALWPSIGRAEADSASPVPVACDRTSTTLCFDSAGSSCPFDSPRVWSSSCPASSSGSP